MYFGVESVPLKNHCLGELGIGENPKAAPLLPSWALLLRYLLRAGLEIVAAEVTGRKMAGSSQKTRLVTSAATTITLNSTSEPSEQAH